MLMCKELCYIDHQRKQDDHWGKCGYLEAGSGGHEQEGARLPQKGQIEQWDCVSSNGSQRNPLTLQLD